MPIKTPIADALDGGMENLNCCGKAMYCGCDMAGCGCCYPCLYKCCGKKSAAAAGAPPAEVEMAR